MISQIRKLKFFDKNILMDGNITKLYYKGYILDPRLDKFYWNLFQLSRSVENVFSDKKKHF